MVKAIRSRIFQCNIYARNKSVQAIGVVVTLVIIGIGSFLMDHVSVVIR